MPEYRAFIVDANGHIIGRHDLVCDSDQEALDLAKLLADGHDVEVWQRERVVSRLPRKSAVRSPISGDPPAQQLLFTSLSSS